MSDTKNTPDQTRNEDEVDESLEETFPASDAPSHTDPDKKGVGD
ncbi:hypothetical protein AA103196_2443 [Ameyamaea chiangmaiensis NBRC 103196]|nr:hypothetical protein [Ameyamaea chiangmaiensis]GBQ70281.1 hypothetical protein AA103196_2443 [Ameyamaea chiangmaiensis NBRC 103196]